MANSPPPSKTSSRVLKSQTTRQYPSFLRRRESIPLSPRIAEPVPAQGDHCENQEPSYPRLSRVSRRVEHPSPFQTSSAPAPRGEKSRSDRGSPPPNPTAIPATPGIHHRTPVHISSLVTGLPSQPTKPAMTIKPCLDIPGQTRTHTLNSAPNAPKSSQIRQNLDKSGLPIAKYQAHAAKFAAPAQKFPRAASCAIYRIARVTPP